MNADSRRQRQYSLCRTRTFPAKQMISERKLRPYGVIKGFPKGGKMYINQIQKTM